MSQVSEEVLGDFDPPLSDSLPQGARGIWRGFSVIWPALCLLFALFSMIAFAEPEPVDLSALVASGRVQHDQGWGQLGLDMAAVNANYRQPIQIQDRTYSRGLGHHAIGRIIVPLDGQVAAFRALLGVQWQGGGKGSVLFKILVDGETRLQFGPTSDSDPPKEVDLGVEGANELQLIAEDAGDGIACDLADWAEARLIPDERCPRFGEASALLEGQPALISPSSAGFSVLAHSERAQMAVMESANTIVMSVAKGEEAVVRLPILSLPDGNAISLEAAHVGRGKIEVEFSLGDGTATRAVLRQGEIIPLRTEIHQNPPKEILLKAHGVSGEAGVRWAGLTVEADGRRRPVPLRFHREAAEVLPPQVLPPLRDVVEQELIEWDWRMQDGIGTPSHPSDWGTAIRRTLFRGDELIRDLEEQGVSISDLRSQWEVCRQEFKRGAGHSDSDPELEGLWRRVHRLRREIALRNPLLPAGPLAFIKQVPGSFSHQLTQYYGRCARPGGGVFILDRPGESMACRPLCPPSLPTGSFQTLDVSYEGDRILFAYCEAPSSPKDWRTESRVFHLFEADVESGDLRQLTDGPWDDFAGRYTPTGDIVFLSTRRGGFHRCGAGPCPVYTLSTMHGDGSDPRVISFHETHEWDPSILPDGRILYTRWDYVDRNAVFYQQLWTVRMDGSGVKIFYGNNTFNPVGIWEARPVPGSHQIMATAGAHHAMTAGSVILLDGTQGVDGPDPITRLTPDVLFSESEAPVQHWYAPVGVPSPPVIPHESLRWPGHCYRSPAPLSDRYFLAAYSYEALIGEPSANRPNMFGIYLMDSVGNKELLYRDLAISSLWPQPLSPRSSPTVVSHPDPTTPKEGTFFLEDVYESWPGLPQGDGDRIHRLRILQVLPKTTPNANQPMVGLAFASPGKQVLGTVPVETDGSAHFRAPSGLPLSFQALDERGRAVQTMRSIVYLQPGETASCIGCHESRMTAPKLRSRPVASRREASAIEPGPDGSKPFSYPLLVQPILDGRCIRCHSGQEPAAGIRLTSEPEGAFTASYNALAARVPFSEWGGGDLRTTNAEPLAPPGRFGARASSVMSMLLKGHHDVALSEEDLERLVTWMDANALFYGTFDPGDQDRQRRGERIAGPALE